MKIRAEVLSVEAHGDCLEVTMQGRPPKGPGWRGLARQVSTVPNTKTNARAFFVGRIINIIVKPE